MLFSSLIFLYVFFPACLLLYFLCRDLRAKNVVLLIASLLFYAWGEPVYLLLMVAVGCELGLWPSARQAAEAKVSGARGDLQSALPRRVQVHGLFAGKRLCASTHRAHRAADRPAHWYLVLHVPGHELCD